MHLVIIGNGIAGITTARHVRKRSDSARITVISSETPYFWSRTALMYIYMGHQKFEHTKPYEDWFWPKNRIDLVHKHVARLDPGQKQLTFTDGETLSYDKLVLATGSVYNKFGWPGQDLEGVQGMVTYQDLQGMEKYSKGLERAVIVGGGLIGIEMAEMFHSRHIPVTFLVREQSFWNKVMPAEESAMINREIWANGIDLRLGSEMTEILPDGNGRVRAVKLKSGEELACQFVGLTAGVHPNLDLAQGTEIETNRGFLVDDYLQTSVPDIYAAGDCAELRQPAPTRRAIEAIWYTGKLMGPDLAATLCGEPTSYRQGVYFNSAKFMDLEWQTYGTVQAEPAAHEAQLYWEHPDGRHSIRLVYDRNDGHLLGFNLMNIRYRQNVCTHWLEQGTHIEEVLQDLGAANFDPEFFKQYEQAVVDRYNAQTGKQLTLKRKRGWAQVKAVLGW